MSALSVVRSFHAVAKAVTNLGICVQIPRFQNVTWQSDFAKDVSGIPGANGKHRK